MVAASRCCSCPAPVAKHWLGLPGSMLQSLPMFLTRETGVTQGVDRRTTWPSKESGPENTAWNGRKLDSHSQVLPQTQSPTPPRSRGSQPSRGHRRCRRRHSWHARVALPAAAYRVSSREGRPRRAQPCDAMLPARRRVTPFPGKPGPTTAEAERVTVPMVRTLRAELITTLSRRGLSRIRSSCSLV